MSDAHEKIADLIRAARAGDAETVADILDIWRRYGHLEKCVAELGRWVESRRGMRDRPWDVTVSDVAWPWPSR